MNLTTDGDLRTFGSINEFKLLKDSGILQIIQSYPRVELFYKDLENDKKSVEYKVMFREASYFNRYC